MSNIMFHSNYGYRVPNDFLKIFRIKFMKMYENKYKIE